MSSFNPSVLYLNEDTGKLFTLEPYYKLGRYDPIVYDVDIKDLLSIRYDFSYIKSITFSAVKNMIMKNINLIYLFEYFNNDVITCLFEERNKEIIDYYENYMAFDFTTRGLSLIAVKHGCNPNIKRDSYTLFNFLYNKINDSFPSFDLTPYLDKFGDLRIYRDKMQMIYQNKRFINANIDKLSKCIDCRLYDLKYIDDINCNLFLCKKCKS